MDSEAAKAQRDMQIAAGHKRVADTFTAGLLWAIAFVVLGVMILRKLPV